MRVEYLEGSGDGHGIHRLKTITDITGPVKGHETTSAIL